MKEEGKVRIFRKKLSVLIVTEKVPLEGQHTIIGNARATSRKKEYIHFAELISSYNYDFDILDPPSLNIHSLVNNGTLNYSIIILTVPFSCLRDDQVEMLRILSHDHGISLLTTFKHPDERCLSLFGIRSLGRTKFLYPRRVKITGWPDGSKESGMPADYSFLAKLAGVRTSGIRKLSLIPTILKIVGAIRNFHISYLTPSLFMKSIEVFAVDKAHNPIAWSYEYGKARNYYFSLDGVVLLDRYNEICRLLLMCVECNSGNGMVSADLRDVALLRLDDPGSCSGEYLNLGARLNAEDWEEYSSYLKEKNIRMSVMYTPGWVDDGNEQRGVLYIDDKKLRDRLPGRVFDSSRVKYVRTAGNTSGSGTLDELSSDPSYIKDHVMEYRKMLHLVEDNVIDIQSHGYTHLTPKVSEWLRSSSIYSDPNWYFEFAEPGPPDQSGSNNSYTSLKKSKVKIKELFGKRPIVFTPSGHKHQEHLDLMAFDTGYLMFSSDFLSYIKKNYVIRNWKIPAIFLPFKKPNNFARKTGIPFIGIVHDYELKELGIRHFHSLISAFNHRSKAKYMTLSELALHLCSEIESYLDTERKHMEIIIRFPLSITENKEDSHHTTLRLRIILPANAELDFMSTDSISVKKGQISRSHLTKSGDLILDLKIDSGETCFAKIPLVSQAVNGCETRPNQNMIC